MPANGDLTPCFNWRYRQDDGWGWSRAHTIEGPCFGCSPRKAVRTCPRCGGRLHRDVAILDDRLGEALFCQQERADGSGLPTRTRAAESEALLAARLEARHQEHRERMDRWIGRVVGGVLAVKVLLAIVFVLLVAAGILTSL
ncbi:hypothetical protein OG352_05275 [Streptomyces sp. NBC_01485]|uniref:hypothetical protein n=1 Tax=Streptomyces sp. NBC_01485 TaxID=2903884 RepID=UPI002E3781F1|nr:hypothetical protein [Streptomyces sp. NBC_01485]